MAKTPPAASLTPGYKVVPYNASMGKVPVIRYKIKYKRVHFWYDMRKDGIILSFEDPFTAKAVLDKILNKNKPKKQTKLFPFE